MADLTALLRPSSLGEFVGQAHIVEPIKKLIAKDHLFHAMFFGPPGSGKTTLSKIIAKDSNRPYFELNATSLKVDELRKIVDPFKGALVAPLIFIDEVHRLSKNQQEVLLPVMEYAQAMIIGASTENPFFALTGAIRSRSLLFEFLPLRQIDLMTILDRAQQSVAKEIDEDAKEYLVMASGGDARVMLKLVEYAAAISEDSVTLANIKSLRQSALSDGASESETHYNLISALIKSIRGSDPDSAIYYLARLIKGAEDPRFIARRLLIVASEDIGNANPEALNLAMSAYQAVAVLGYPEARITLAQIVIYLACSPKSNSAYVAIDRALEVIGDGLLLEVPNHLKDAHFQGAKDLGRGVGYKYPHDYGGYVEQQYTMKPVKFVDFIEVAYEKRLKEWLEKIREIQSD